MGSLDTQSNAGLRIIGSRGHSHMILISSWLRSMSGHVNIRIFAISPLGVKLAPRDIRPGCPISPNDFLIINTACTVYSPFCFYICSDLSDPVCNQLCELSFSRLFCGSSICYQRAWLVRQRRSCVLSSVSRQIAVFGLSSSRLVSRTWPITGEGNLRYVPSNVSANLKS